MGTWLLNNDEAQKSRSSGHSCVYKAFDTARDYGNEVGVGKGIWNSYIFPDNQSSNCSQGL